jgi:hypothetical protein
MKFRYFPWLIGTLLVANIFDAGASLYVLGLGVPELNPIMAALYAHGPATFLAAKVVTTALVVLVLFASNNKEPGLLVWLAAALYLVLFIYEVIGLTALAVM